MGATVLQGYRPETNPRRVLLFNPPVYDTRFPWSNWQQPTSLLQLATLLRHQGSEVRLIDALHFQSNQRLTRRRIRILTRNEISINYWRYGQLQVELAAQIKALSLDGWLPDDIYIEGFTTFWWEGAVETIKLVRQKFPHARVILYGAYPSFASEHALIHSDVDILVIGPIKGLAGLPLDLSLYPSPPSFTYLSIGTNKRQSSDVIDEFLAKAKPTNRQECIRRFAFSDHNVIHNYPEQFRSLLKVVIDQKHKVSFYALGNIYAHDLVNDPELASLLYHAGFKQLVFADDRNLPITEEAREEELSNYYYAIEHCIKAGYRWRTEDLVGSVCIGRPGESLEQTTMFMTKVAHAAGSLIVVPYQPFPTEFTTNVPLEYQNGKLFPFAEYNGVSFRQYQDVLGLAAILNAKYRSHTFDFSGEGLISRLVRSSLVSEHWDPHNTPGVHNEKPITIGWFNKEGKWVKS